jgi:hypothetical protein
MHIVIPILVTLYREETDLFTDCLGTSALKTDRLLEYERPEG